MKIKIPELKQLVHDVLRTAYSEEDANRISEVIMFGELSGKQSHGILRLLKENYGVFVDQKTEPSYIHKTKISTIIEGNGNPGMLVGPLAMHEVMRIGKEHDIGIVGTRGSINTTGALSYYVEQIAKQNLIGMIFAHASAFIAPFDSKKALFGTNPLAFGFPAEPSPLLFDMSTAAITYGAIAKYKSEGKPLPEGVAIDEQGVMTTDPVAAAALLPLFNSYKGSGLAMMVELLGGLWPGAGFTGLHTEDGWGNVFMAFSPDLLSDVKTFKARMAECIDEIKNTKKTTGKKIRLPGEHAIALRDKNLSNGYIEVNDTIFNRVKNLLAT